MNDFIRCKGFTDEPLDWRSWLDVVDAGSATAEQVAVLEKSHPQAKTSDYYLTLVHQPAILQQRSAAYNAIMYAPGGLPRAERELCALTVSRINGCVYCASVHAQRFEQLAKRNDVAAQLFIDPAHAGTNVREKAIIRFATLVTNAPEDLGSDDIDELKDAGFTMVEIVDMLNVASVFAWANRLMMNLGEPVSVAST